MERVLVVEDDGFSREMFSDLLEEEGYEVDTAASGEEAIEKLNTRDYHVVVTDLVMRNISGLDILAAVKRQDPAIGVIMVTGHANMETAVYALKNGAHDYLIKPVNQDEFKHAVALCLEQRRLLDENQELKGLVKLLQVSQTIANCLDLERLYPLVVDVLAKEVGVNKGLGYFFDGGSSLVLKDVKGFSEAFGTRLGSAIMETFNCQGEKGESVIRLNNFLPSWFIEGSGIEGDLSDAMLLFIRTKAHPQGVVMLFNEPGMPFLSDINYKNLNFIIDQSSLALENAARYTTARSLLYVDELTGLFNYRYLEVAMEREVRRAERYGSSLAVIFLDMDLFKQVNDNHGHLNGTKVLREVGLLISKSVRDVDTVIRYGGDEYTVILVETDMAGAAVVAERIRLAIEQHDFLVAEGLKVKLTASLGYSCFPEDSRSKVELLELADQAMYRGKASGKNVVYSLSGRKSGQMPIINFNKGD